MSWFLQSMIIVWEFELEKVSWLVFLFCVNICRMLGMFVFLSFFVIVIVVVVFV